jgi:hypothetical protein
MGGTGNAGLRLRRGAVRREHAGAGVGDVAGDVGATFDQDAVPVGELLLTVATVPPF